MATGDMQINVVFEICKWSDRLTNIDGINFTLPMTY